jgi:hypothetical protein
MQRIRSSGAAALALGLVLAACSGTEPGEGNNENTAQMRMLNTAAGATSLDLVIGGKVIVSGVGVDQASALASVPGGTQTLAVRRTGQTANLITKDVQITQGAKYSLVVAGTLASLSLTPSVVSDTGLARPDRANIRIINIGVDVPTDSSQAPQPVFLDVYITAPGADLATASPVMAMDARYSSYSSLIYFAPGSYVVRFTTANTKTVRAATVTIDIPAGQVRAVTLQKQGDGTFRTSVVAEN